MSYPFSEATAELIALIWTKGRLIPNQDPAVWRQDIYGSWMKFSDHGNVDSKCGWEIDHIVPVARRGTDEVANLQPLQWQNNRSKGDS